MLDGIPDFSSFLTNQFMDWMIRLIVSITGPGKESKPGFGSRLDFFQQLQRGGREPGEFKPFPLQNGSRLQRREMLERQRAGQPCFICPFHEIADPSGIRRASNGLMKFAIEPIGPKRRQMKILLSFRLTLFRNRVQTRKLHREQGLLLEHTARAARAPISL